MKRQKILAFIKKDFLIESSYKMAFLITIVNSVIPVLSFFFVGKLVNDNPHVLDRYGNNYFNFMLVGVAFSNYFMVAINTFSITMRRAQMAGCLEAILSSQTSPKSVVLMSSFYSFLSAGIQLIIVLAAGVFIFGFDFSQMNLPSALLAWMLSLLAFIGLGIISAGGTILFKQGEPFGWIAGALSAFLGGVYFPVSIMPEWLQFLSSLLPISHSLEALRLSILQGHSPVMLWRELIILAAFAFVLLPLGLSFFNYAIERGKRNGTLVHF